MGYSPHRLSDRSGIYQKGVGMNKRTRRLAKKAGFIFWTGERYSTGEIDWSSVYDLELEEFERLVRRDEAKRCAQICSELAEDNRESPTDSLWQWEECASAIMTHRKRDLNRKSKINW